MNSFPSIDQSLQSAFKLAYFIHEDEQSAIEIATQAADKLDLASEVQGRRSYYKPTGGSRTKVSFSRKHLLQRLVYIESERYERLKESTPHLLSQQDLLVHFIKHLIRITIKRNSFYVALGITRLLHSYTTMEAMEIYNFLVQDPDGFREDSYYRIRKKQLMQEMKDRFGDLIRTYKTSQREERFQSQARSGEYVDLTRNCMMRFLPWDTECVLPPELEPSGHEVDGLLFRGGNPDEKHAIEINRIHSALDPECFRRVVSLLGLALPEYRLEIPLFFISDNNQPRSQKRYDPPDLDENRLNAMKKVIQDRARRRKESIGDLLSIRVDGQDCARLNLHRTDSVQLQVENDSEMIEVGWVDRGNDLPLAIHFFNYGESGIQSGHHTLTLASGQKLSFRIDSLNDTADDAPGMLVTVEYKETNPFRFARLAIIRSGARIGNALVPRHHSLLDLIRSPLAIALIFCVILLAIYFRLSGSDRGGLDMAGGQKSERAANTNSAPDTPDQTRTAETPDQGQPPGQRTLTAAANTNTPRILRPANDITDKAEPRSLTAEEKYTSLKTIRQIYIDSIGTNSVSQQARALLVESLLSTGRFMVIQEREKADAVIEGAVTRTAEGKASIHIEIVNVDGKVIWPINRKKKYAGQLPAAIAEMMKDLLADIQTFERR